MNLTPGQQKMWERMQERPVLKMLIDRLGLEPEKSAEQKRNEKISEWVEVTLDQMKLAPKEKMVVIPARRNPFENPDLSWLKPGEVPF